MKVKTTILILLLLPFYLCAQVPQPELKWVKTLGNTGVDEGWTVMAIEDDGFVVASLVKTPSTGDFIPKFNVPQSFDICLVKYDNQKNIVWNKCYGSTPVDYPRKIVKMKNGDYMLGGSVAGNDGDITNKNWGGWDVWLLRLDTAGNIKWNNTYGTNGSEFLTDMIVTLDDGIILTSYSNIGDGDIDTVFGGTYDCFIIKLDSAGNKQWSRNIGGTGDDIGAYITQGTDSSYYFAMCDESMDNDCTQQGYALNGFPDTNLPVSTDIYVAKLDKQGNMIWHYDYGGTWNERISGGIIYNADHTLYVAAETMSGDYMASCNAQFDSDALLLKIDTAGHLIWSRCVGGSKEEECWGICSNGDGGCVVFGNSHSDDEDIPFNFPYVISGNPSYDAFAVNIDGNGNTIWGATVGGTKDDRFYGGAKLSNGNFVLVGQTYSSDGNINQIADPLHGDLLMAELSKWPVKVDDFENHKIELAVYPNPTTDIMNVLFKKQISGIIQINDIQGKVLAQSNINEMNTSINMSGFANGLYLLNIYNKNHQVIYTQKVCKQ